MVRNHSDGRRYPEPSGEPDRFTFKLPHTHQPDPAPTASPSARRPNPGPGSRPRGLPLSHGKSQTIQPIKPTTPVAHSRDGDQFDTEQPPHTLGKTSQNGQHPSTTGRTKPADAPTAVPPGSVPLEPPAGWMDPPALPASSASGDGPSLRLVGRTADHAGNASPQPAQTRNTSSVTRPGHVTHTRTAVATQGLPAIPFRQPTAASISASGVMLDLEPVGQPILSATDPRWVLALRTAESLQGTILPPERRQQLIRLGKVMGMTAFDANLVIAIIQDQARRGYAADFCPTAGEGQLQMVPLPRLSAVRQSLPGRGALKLALAITCVLALEILIFHWWLG